MSSQPCDLREACDEHAFGGKAVALSTAVRAGLPVPRGLALPVELVTAVQAGDAPSRTVVRRAAEQVGLPVAVRSSAVGEDGVGSSFAGQHLTLLNVCAAEQVVEAVAEVGASACAPAAVAYRRARGDDSAPCSGVVLQRQVPADVAGVLFTRHPVTGADELVVEASWALGEAVVGGLVTPDLFRLERGGRVLEEVLGDKDLAVVPRQGGGTATLPVEADRAGRACLDPGQLQQLAQLAARCDEVFGAPSDLEWAFAGGRLTLLQRRPLTSTGR